MTEPYYSGANKPNTDRKVAPINNRTSKPTVKPDSTFYTVFSPSEGQAYAHHPSICDFDGKLYAIWSVGIKNEDDCGQKVMISSSADGENWSEPKNLITPAEIGTSKTVLTACGLYSDGKTLHVYFGKYDYSVVGEDGFRLPGDCNHVGAELYCISSSDGVNWDAPKSMKMPIISNHPPVKTASGKLILPASVTFPYTNDLSGQDGWVVTGIYGDAFKDRPVVDDSESIHYVTKFNGWNCNLICEGSLLQADDGTLRMLLRSNSDYMWISESYDDGESWTAPQKTRFTNGNTKFHFGKLPSGKFYCINNSVISNDRYPLNLHLSDDGINFDQSYILRDEPYEIKYRGLYKGGAYAYPHSAVWKDCLYVIYSKCKETIEVTKLDLKNL